jgi:GNAT superfamily N-acetyltransferase
MVRGADGAGGPPATPYRLEERPPTPDEYRALRAAVGWGAQDEEAVRAALTGALYSVCATLDGAVVGCGRVVGDGGLYYYVQDIVVTPRHQGRGVGRLIMDAVMRYFRAHARRGAFIGLMAADGKAGFYERYGFAARPSPGFGPGMQLRPS